MYPYLDLTTAFLNSTYKKYSSLCVGEERFGSGTESRLYKHARVMVSWVGDEGKILFRISRPGRVNYFFEHSFVIDKNGHCFACVQWFKEYPNNSLFKNPLSVYYAKVFKLPGSSNIHPCSKNSVPICCY